MSVAGSWCIGFATIAIPDNRLSQRKLAYPWLARVSWVVRALPPTATRAVVPRRKWISRATVTLPITPNGNRWIGAALCSNCFSQLLAQQRNATDDSGSKVPSPFLRCLGVVAASKLLVFMGAIAVEVPKVSNQRGMTSKKDGTLLN